LPGQLLAQSNDDGDAPITKPSPKPTKPSVTKPTGAKPTKPTKTQPSAKPRATSPVNDGALPSTVSDPDATDPLTLIQRNDAEGDFEILKGDLPCLDSSAACIASLVKAAIANSPSLKKLDEQVAAANDSIKNANAGGGNIFRLIQPVVPLLGVPLLGIGGGALGTLVNTLAGNSRTDQTTSQANADLQIKVAQIERTKQEVSDRIQDSVTQEVIKFDELRLQAETQAAIANRETSRFKLLEVAYRLGEGDTASFLEKVNALDRVRVSVSVDKAKMRSQAIKVRRIVLGEDA
jgi:hypothetical protein